YLPELPPIHSCSELVAPASCRLSRGRLAPGGGRDARRTAAETAALRKPACVGPDALVRVVERNSTVFCDPPRPSRVLLGPDGSETRPYTTQNHFFGSFTSEASMTGAGPEIPPSLRTRQKCTIISTEATIGIPMQCQM